MHGEEPFFIDAISKVIAEEVLDESERDFLIGIMTPLLPDYRAEVVEQALGYACRNLKHPRSTDDIINIVKTFVGKV